MYDICCVNLPRSAAARLWKVSLQLPHLSVFSLIKRVFRDALNQIKATIYKTGGDYLAKYHVLGIGYDYDYYSLATAKWIIDADSQ